ncbi:NAD(P)/FAD-dependent oxidoreductase [Streptomyces sp. CMB-StM0423]|uniref:NAD(P)/FAD-dependent oxidoreductase n=1 Tax=Streptomyces sp. CMB-StM0423 TaxID=2059884 RepID=UPI000C70DC73|nr:FAD-dependent oxidoreductase [Streptomyces sp. CMB-StM0423]AUH43107.1 FAD-dependent oxidoreductase [Streptomyces sp. CMB-StM0423]
MSLTEPVADRPAGGRRVVIVGGGMAGTRLARQLAGAGARVTVVGEEPHAPYNRVLLADVLAGRYAPDVIRLPDLPAAPAVRVLRGVRAVRVDRAARRVECDDGRAVPYDVLVLATGAWPVLPPLRGLFDDDGDGVGGAGVALPAGVHAFRTMDDCLALAAATIPGAAAVVVGGGLLGVSAARALARRGARVVLAQQGERLMERQLDPPAARLLRGHLEDLGVEVHTECRVRGVRTRPAVPGDGSDGVRGEGRVRGVTPDPVVPDPGRAPRPSARRAPGGGSAAPAGPAARSACGAGSGDGSEAPVDTARAAASRAAGATTRSVTGVELADGYVLDARLVVLACGVRPRVGLARAAGLDVGAGVVVDDELRTSDPAVHAIGDCAEHAGVLYGLAAPALEQADVLARVLTGTPPHRYTGTRALTRLTLSAADTPLDLAAFGVTEPAPGDDVVHLADATRRVYRKVVVRADRLVGGILLGDLAAVGTLARAWEGDAPLPPGTPLHHLLTDHLGGS